MGTVANRARLVMRAATREAGLWYVSVGIPARGLDRQPSPQMRTNAGTVRSHAGPADTGHNSSIGCASLRLSLFDSFPVPGYRKARQLRGEQRGRGAFLAKGTKLNRKARRPTNSFLFCWPSRTCRRLHALREKRPAPSLVTSAQATFPLSGNEKEAIRAQP